MLNLTEANDVVNPENPDVVRLILYIDKQANGAAVSAVTDILETASWNSFRNLANQQRFQILSDRKFVMNYTNMASDAAGQFSTASVYKQIDKYWKVNAPIEFSATTGAIGEIRSNNIGVLAISATGRTQLLSKVRLRFSDN